MNIDKQDERLLHEILSKYKQGLITGLIPGSNITLTPTGCRNKTISSTGGSGNFDLYTETISYPLGDPINLTGDEVFFIAGAEGLTLSLTQLSTAILSQVTNIGGAFLEKEQVNTSRSFQSSDKNKILYIGSNTRLTVANGITFADGDIIGVSYSIDSPDNRSGFSIVPNGHLIFPYCSIDSVPNEVVYLSALNIEGQTVLIPISTFIKISDAINNEAKTGLRYLMDNTSGQNISNSNLIADTNHNISGNAHDFTFDNYSSFTINASEGSGDGLILNGTSHQRGVSINGVSDTYQGAGTGRGVYIIGTSVTLAENEDNDIEINATNGRLKFSNIPTENTATFYGKNESGRLVETYINLRYVISKSESVADVDFSATPGKAYVLPEVASSDKVITLDTALDGDIYRFNNVVQPTNNFIVSPSFFLPDGTVENVVPASKITIIQYDAAQSRFNMISSQ